ncbi:glycosyltransferase family 4 protein [Paenibacillus sp. TRM 82003]|nr:glycosyltransferase family 4 protein [Paenibacillus sp. TRM 82003]
MIEIDRENEYFLFVTAANKSFLTSFRLPSNFHLVEFRFDNDKRLLRTLWQQFALPLQVKKLKLDILHFPAYTGTLFAKCKKVVTVHDIQYVHYPEYFSTFRRLYLKTFIPLTMKASDLVIAVSEFTKQDIVRCFRIPAEKVVVTYEGVDYNFQKAEGSSEKTNEVLRKYNIPTDIPYILSVANYTPHKNIDTLLMAFGKLKREQSFEGKLVLVGNNHREFDPLIEKLDIGGDVVMTGFVDDRDLPIVYRSASVYVFPSLFEGFGLPVVEAFHSEVPVVLSDRGSLPEIGGDATELFQAKDPDSLRDAIVKVLLGDRQGYVDRGKERLSEFDFRKMAVETLEIYKQLGVGQMSHLAKLSAKTLSRGEL